MTAMPNPQGPGLVERMARIIDDRAFDESRWLQGDLHFRERDEKIALAKARAMLAELPLREIAEALELAAPVFCRGTCPIGTPQRWPHDPLCDQVRTALAMIEEISGEERDG